MDALRRRALGNDPPAWALRDDEKPPIRIPPIPAGEFVMWSETEPDAVDIVAPEHVALLAHALMGMDEDRWDFFIDAMRRLSDADADTAKAVVYELMLAITNIGESPR